MTDPAQARLDVGANPAVVALADALSAITRTIDATVAQGDDDAAFELIVDLDEALSASTALGESLSALLAAGQPGVLVEADLRRFSDVLEQRGTEVAARRAQLSSLAEMQDTIRSRAAEADDVQMELQELQRLERLGSSLEQLRAARLALEESSGAAMEAVGAEEALLAQAAATALTAMEGAAESLRAKTREQLARVEASAAALSKRRTELATTRDDIARDEAEVERLMAEIESSEQHHEAVRVRLAKLRSGWQAHLDADQEIAGLLLETVRGTGPVVGDHPRGGDLEADSVDEVSAHIAAHLCQLDGLLETLLVEAEAQDQHDHRRRRVRATATAPSDGSPSPS